MGRDRLQRVLRGDAVDRPAWLPLPGAFLGRLGGASYPEITADPGRLFGALADVVRLLGADAAVVLPDPSLLAEAVGATMAADSGNAFPNVAAHLWADALPAAPPRDVVARARLGVALETFRRLRLAAPDAGLALAVAGPGLLSSQLRGPRFIEGAAGGEATAEDCLDLAGQVVLQVVRVAGEIGGEMLIVLESMFRGEATRLLAEAWRPLTNLAAFYGLPVLAVPFPAGGPEADDGAANGGGRRASGDSTPGCDDLRPWGCVMPLDGRTAVSIEHHTARPVVVPGVTDALLAAGAGGVRASLDQLAAADPHVLSTDRPLGEDSSLSGLLEVKEWLEGRAAH